MSSVTFSTAVGGDGSTVTDDNNATTGLREGGWKTRFIPCFTQQIAVANYVVTKANEASSSASSAATSATEATTNGAAQVTLAAAQVTLATAQANAAAASYDSFDDRYLGSKTSDPSVDNDGNTLLVGALYWNSTSSVMKVWTGSSWVNPNPAIGYLALAGGTMTGAITFAAGQFGTNVATFLTTPSSANLAAALTDETGTGVNVFNNTPTLIEPLLGTPTSGNLSNCTNAIAYTLKSATTDIAISSSTAPTTGQVLTATSSTDATWQSPASSISSVVRSAKTSAYTLVAGDKGTLIEVTSGTFTLSLTAAATLGSGWWCYVSNIGTGLITIDPNSTETITVNGAARSTWVQWTTEVGILQCDGTGFNYYQMQKGYAQQTVSSNVSSLIFSSGIVGRKALRLNVQQANFAASSSMQLRVNNGNPVWMKRNGLESVGSGYIAAYDSTFYLYGAEPSTGNASDFFSANIDFSASINGVTVSGGWSGKATGSEKGYFTGIGYFTTSNFNEIRIVISSGSANLSAGTFTLTEL